MRGPTQDNLRESPSSFCYSRSIVQSERIMKLKLQSSNLLHLPLTAIAHRPCGAMHTSRAPNLQLKIFPPLDVARSESGELSRDGHRPSTIGRAVS